MEKFSISFKMVKLYYFIYVHMLVCHVFIVLTLVEQIPFQRASLRLKAYQYICFYLHEVHMWVKTVWIMKKI